MHHTTDRIAHTTAFVTPVVETRQYNRHIFGKIILFNYSTTTILSIMISYFHICFCTFDLSCSILENNNFIENLYIVLSCLIK